MTNGQDQPRDLRTLQVLVEVVGAPGSDSITVGEIVDGIRGRAFGLLLLLFGAVDVVPLPPGASSLAGVPVLIIGVQMALGRPRPWLPQVLRRRSFEREKLVNGLRRIEPYVRALARVSRPRWPRVVRALFPRFVGTVVIVLALVIMLPAFFTNTPPALATVLLAIALIEEDGLLLIVGLAAAVLAVAISAVLAGGLIAVLLVLFGDLLRGVTGG